MEDLGEAVENFVDTFSCVQNPSSSLPKQPTPATHGNLLVASSLYGHLFAAVGSSIVVHSHESLRNGGSSPAAVVDLREHHVSSVYALALGAHDTIIANVSKNSKSSLVILAISALVAGKIHAFRSPSGTATAFSVSEPKLTADSQIVATLEGKCVQLHEFTEDGTTPTTRVDIANARCITLSPSGSLLAVGTERGSVIIYSAKTGELCSTIVEVESGWVPFSTHFADGNSILVSYNCEAEVRHVVWRLSADGTTIEGHSALGELCLALFPFDEEPTESPVHPMLTCISLHDWNMCVIGSSMSNDVEIIRKADSGWEVWKFDEGKSPTLPTDDNDDDTHCVGLAFDLNDTATIPGTDAASPEINPMPRVIVYTTDFLLLPFTLIDSNPGVKCESVRKAAEVPPIPISLRSLESASALHEGSNALLMEKSDSITEQRANIQSSSGFQQGQQISYTHNLKQARHDTLAVDKGARKRTLPVDAGQPALHNLWTSPSSTEEVALSAATPDTGLKNVSLQQQPFKDVDSFLGNFTFQESSKSDAGRIDRHSLPSSTTMKANGRPNAEFHQKNVMQTTTVQRTAVQAKPKVMLSTSLSVAEAEANHGDLFALVRSILTEMAEELRVSAEAEHIVSKEIATQKDTMAASISATREQLIRLLQSVRMLFQNEATLRSSVSSTLTKVLSLSREYEKMSLEFHVKEADGFSQSLRAEEKEFDDKISVKEDEVLRSIGSIEDRLHAEAEIHTRRKDPGELVQQVYSSLALQGIRIKRVRSLLAVLKERMEVQDKGGRLSHLGLSLARLEKLKIHDEEATDQSTSPDKSTNQNSAHGQAALTPHKLRNIVNPHTANNLGDDTQLLKTDVRAVMRRLAMSGGRARISVTMPQSRAKSDRLMALKNGSAAFEAVNPLEGFQHADTRAVKTSESAKKPVRQSSSQLFANSAPYVDGKRNESDATQVSSLGFSSSQSLRPQGIGSGTKAISSMLPPRKPPNQQHFSTLAQPNNQSNLSMNSTTVKNSDLATNPELLTKPGSNIPSAQRGAYANAQVQKEEAKEPPALTDDRASLSASFASSTNHSSIPTTLNHEAVETTSSMARPDILRSSQKTELLSARAKDSEESAPTSNAPQLAHLPPDDDESEQKTTVPGRIAQFAGLPPEGDEPRLQVSTTTSSSVSQGTTQVVKNAPQVGLFAALPPDSEQSGASLPSSKTEERKPPVTSASSSGKASSTSGLFAALPPDPATEDTSKRETQSQEKRDNTSFLDDKKPESLKSIITPSKRTESLGTSELFASLPPDESDSGYERDNGKKRATTSSLTSAFADGPGNASKGPSTMNQSASPFGATSQFLSGFGKASLFGTNASGTQSAAAISAPEKPSVQDGSSSDSSEEAVARLGGRMDTSSGEQGFSGISKADEKGFGFGYGQNNTSGDTSFGQSSASPFGSMSQTPPFGQSQSQPSAQAGFGSFAVSQGSVPSTFQNAQAAFGSMSSFGAAASQSGFGTSASQSGFGSSTPQAGFGSNVPQSAFGTATPQSNFGTTTSQPAFGMNSAFGVASPLGASSSFGVPSQLGGGSSPFGASNTTFGTSMSAPTFGESQFGKTSSFGAFSQISGNSGFGNSSSAPNSSPFGNVGASGGFGAASTGGSGFAALAGGQNRGLTFGNAVEAPSFTSAAFSQRRA